MGTAALSRARC